MVEQTECKNMTEELLCRGPMLWLMALSLDQHLGRFILSDLDRYIMTDDYTVVSEIWSIDGIDNAMAIIFKRWSVAMKVAKHKGDDPVYGFLPKHGLLLHFDASQMP